MEMLVRFPLLAGYPTLGERMISSSGIAFFIFGVVMAFMAFFSGKKGSGIRGLLWLLAGIVVGGSLAFAGCVSAFGRI